MTSTRSIKYYFPHEGLVNYLENQLLYLKGQNESNQDESNQKRGNKVRKSKFDYMNHIFQSITDLVYFLEFIERNHEDLEETFSHDLKNLFGYNPHIAEDEYESINQYHSALKRYPGSPMMRLVRSSLLLNRGTPKNKLDFRTTVISQIFLSQSIEALLKRIDGEEEKFLATQDTHRGKIWGRYLEKQVREKRVVSNRRIGYYPCKS